MTYVRGFNALHDRYFAIPRFIRWLFLPHGTKDIGAKT
jgi:hypothetical protein